MRTRQQPRRQIDLPGRYFTGVGAPVDVVVSDVSEGGCRFPIGAARLAPGTPLQLTIAASGPHRATVRWIEDGAVGVVFAQPLSAELVEQLKSGANSDHPAAAAPAKFEPAPDQRPQRFC